MKKLILTLIIVVLFMIAFFPTIGRLTNSYAINDVDYELEEITGTEYSVSNNTITMALTEDITTDPITLLPNLPLYNDSFTMMINGSFLSVAETFSYSENTLTEGATTNNISSIRFHPTKNEYAVSRAETPYSYVFDNENDTLLYATLPSYVNAAGRGVAYSNDGTMLAFIFGSSPYLRIYDITTDPYTVITNPTTLPSAGLYSVTFTDDDAYLVIGGSSGSFMYIYDTSTIPFTLVSNPSTSPTNMIRYMAATTNGSNLLALGDQNSPYFFMYDTSTNPFTLIDTSYITQSAQASGISFSHDGKYLVFANSTTTYRMYDITTTPFTQITLPSFTLASTYYASWFSTNNQLLILGGGANANNVVLLDITTDPFTLLTIDFVQTRAINTMIMDNSKILVGYTNSVLPEYSIESYTYSYSAAYFNIYNDDVLLYSLTPNESYVDELINIDAQTLKNIIIETNKIDDLSTSNIEIEFTFNTQYLENDSVFTPLIKFMPLVVFVIIVTIAVAYVSRHKNA